MQNPYILKVACSIDPAVDHSKGTTDQMVKYIESRDPKDLEPFLNAKQPAWFHLIDIPRPVFARYVQTAPSEPERFLRALRASLRLVEHLQQDDGVELPSWEPPVHEGLVTEQALERLDYCQIEEIGLVAYWRCFLGRKTTAPYPRPPTSLHVLAVKVFRPADANPSTQATASENPSSPLEAPPPNQEQTATAS